VREHVEVLSQRKNNLNLIDRKIVQGLYKKQVIEEESDGNGQQKFASTTN